jgi:hypothetical protein
MLGYQRRLWIFSLVDLFGDYHKVHIPGSPCNQMGVEVHARDGTRTYKPNPSKEELNHHKIKMKSWPRTMMRCQRKQVKKGRRKKKKVAKEGAWVGGWLRKRNRSENTLDEDDTSVAKRTSTVMMMILLAWKPRAMVSFREKILDYIISQPIPEVTTILKRRIHLLPTQWW